MKEILKHLFEYKSFSKSEAYTILTHIAAGQYNASEMAAFLTAYNMRGIRDVELEGFRDAMYDLCLKMDFSNYALIDLCGTGGDGKNTFNISTLAAFVVAGAGHKVAKHGNYGVSSGCGSSNVMEYLGYTFTNNADILYRSLDQANIAFLHAPLFHPAMKTLAPIRKALGVKTFVNMLGPLVNPANPKFQVVGVFSLELARLYGYVYQKSAQQFSIVHTLDGYDEISLTAPFKLINNREETLIDLRTLGFDRVDPENISGGETVAEAAKIFTDIIRGKGSTEQNRVVLCNAALALQTLDRRKSFIDCYDEAEESLTVGKAYNCLKRLVGVS